MCAAKKGDAALYAAEAVVDCRYKKDRNRIEYKVRWAKCNNKREIGFEPLHHLQSCPLLVLQYEKNVYRQWKLDKNYIRGTRKEPLPTPFKNLYLKVTPSEYLPTGREFVRKIYSTWACSYEQNENHELVPSDLQYFLVRFKGIRERKVVQRLFMDYYFPVDVLKFWRRSPQSINY